MNRSSNRLTKYNGKKFVLPQGKGSFRAIAERLAAYEETGLEPEEIIRMLDKSSQERLHKYTVVYHIDGEYQVEILAYSGKDAEAKSKDFLYNECFAPLIDISSSLICIVDADGNEVKI